MTVEEIDLLIGSIDRSTKEGQRNRAILETLYSCGLRVSELCNLKLSELYLKKASSKWKERKQTAAGSYFTARHQGNQALLHRP